MPPEKATTNDYSLARAIAPIRHVPTCRIEGGFPKTSTYTIANKWNLATLKRRNSGMPSAILQCRRINGDFGRFPPVEILGARAKNT